MADPQRDDLVLARITSRWQDHETDVTGPLLTTVDELADQVREMVVSLAMQVIGKGTSPSR